MTLRLATRRSPLALIQARYVQGRLAEQGVESELVLMETKGDREAGADLATMGGEGLFAVEIQRALLNGEADVAVHSAKDLPSSTPEGLALVSVPERRDAADVLVGKSLAGLGPGATVATGSPRRRALLLERRPDLRVIGLRGNMATRLGSAGKNGVDAVVAAMAAIERLEDVDIVSERLDPTWFVPQVGQGALGLEARVDDDEIRDVLRSINDEAAFRAVVAERAFLEELGAGCSIPAGAYADVDQETVTLRGVMIAPDGSKSVRAELVGTDPHQLGSDLARLLRDDMSGGALLGWES
ncbi:MAG TPA: hydroxymethylbilane synthase [Acidimicrobiales bacterium]|nr:hydroxymethylbilane synthase [Acidimicrobiales bacterium]